MNGKIDKSVSTNIHFFTLASDIRKGIKDVSKIMRWELSWLMISIIDRPLKTTRVSGNHNACTADGKLPVPLKC
jgi:hypothetical protein